MNNIPTDDIQKLIDKYWLRLKSEWEDEGTPESHEFQYWNNINNWLVSLKRKGEQNE